MTHLRRMLTSLLALGLLATVFVATPSSAETENTNAGNPVSYRVTITNESGQPVTPPVLAVHTAKADVYEVGEPAIAPVQAIAENGDISQLVEVAPTLPGVKAAAVAGEGPLFPGESVTTRVDSVRPGNLLTLISMVVCTNDGFTGLDSVQLPRTVGEPTTFSTVAYDAGTEVNDEDTDYWVPPCSPDGESPNMHTDENGVIAAHPGLSGFGDLDFATGDTILNVEVERINPNARTYELTFTNLSGQPLTPPVVGIHTNKADIFEVGEAAIDEVVEIAENGNIDPLVELAPTVPGVKAAAVAGDGPLMPGQKATITVETTRPGRLLSVVSMIVCTNDGIAGIDSVKIPTTIGESRFRFATAYDAGSEVNDEDTDYWVPPCSPDGDSPNMHTDENGVIAAHPGLSGFGDLDFEAGARMIRVKVTRVG